MGRLWRSCLSLGLWLRHPEIWNILSNFLELTIFLMTLCNSNSHISSWSYKSSHTHKKGKLLSITELTKNPHYVVPSVFREASLCWSSNFSIVSWMKVSTKHPFASFGFYKCPLINWWRSLGLDVLQRTVAPVHLNCFLHCLVIFFLSLIQVK